MFVASGLRGLGIVVLLGSGCTPAPSEAPSKSQARQAPKPKPDSKPDAKPESETGGSVPTDATTDTRAAQRRSLLDAVPIPDPVPTPVAFGYRCSHSAQPFGTRYWSRTVVVDLQAAVRTDERDEGDEADPSAAKETKTSTQLDRATVGELRTKLDAVLAGGPYEPVFPVPEGVSCWFELYSGGETVFSVSRAGGFGPPDPVGALLEAGVPPN